MGKICRTNRLHFTYCSTDYTLNAIYCYYLRAYFFWKAHTDINNGLISYIQVKWRRSLDAVSGVRSLSVLLSAVEMTQKTQIALVLVC